MNGHLNPAEPYVKQPEEQPKWTDDPLDPITPGTPAPTPDDSGFTYWNGYAFAARVDSNDLVLLSINSGRTHSTMAYVRPFIAFTVNR